MGSNSFETIGIRDPGNLEKERLLIRAIEPIQLESFIVINVESCEGGITILNDKVFWFPKTAVNAGEFVRLYTKKGTYEKTESMFGSTPAVYHNFYWGKEKPIVDGTDSNAFTILKASGWTTALSKKV